MRLTLTLAAMAALMAPATAADFAQSTGSWHVFDAGDVCSASSRPMLEAKNSPYNLLVLSVTKTEEMAPVQVNFWPGAFVAGAEVTLTFQPAARDLATPAPDPTMMVAIARSDYELISKDAMSERVIEAAGRGRSVSVSAEGVDQTLVFDATDLMDAGELIEDCVGRNP